MGNESQPRGGAARNSEEASVMDVEQRGCTIRLKEEGQLEERMTSPKRAKQIEISKREVLDAWIRV